MAAIVDYPQKTFVEMPSGIIQFPDSQKLQISDWLKCWEKNDTPWHFSNPNLLLQEYYDMCFGESDNLRVLVPLSGKSVDLRWLLSRGCKVTGVEISEIGVRQFFAEQEMQFKDSLVDDVRVFEAIDYPLKMFCCDFLKFDQVSTCSDFDLIWDRNAFVAINEDERQKYVRVIRKLCHPKTKLFVSAFEYDRTKYPGPPHSFQYHDLETYFGPCFHYEELKTREVLEDFRCQNWGVDWLLEHFYIMDPK